MKKRWAIVIVILILVVGCSNAKQQAYVDKIALTKEEERIANMFGVDVILHLQVHNAQDVLLKVRHYKNNKLVDELIETKYTNKTIKLADLNKEISSSQENVNPLPQDLFYSIQRSDLDNALSKVVDVNEFGVQNKDTDTMAYLSDGLKVNFDKKYAKANFIDDLKNLDHSNQIVLEKNKEKIISIYAVDSTKANINKLENIGNKEAIVLTLQLID